VNEQKRNIKYYDLGLNTDLLAVADHAKLNGLQYSVFLFTYADLIELPQSLWALIRYLINDIDINSSHHLPHQSTHAQQRKSWLYFIVCSWVRLQVSVFEVAQESNLVSKVDVFLTQGGL